MTIFQNLYGEWNEKIEFLALKKNGLDTSIQNIIAFRTMLEEGQNSINFIHEQKEFLQLFNVFTMPLNSFDKMMNHINSGIVDYHITYGFIPKQENFYKIRNTLYYLDWG